MAHFEEVLFRVISVLFGSGVLWIFLKSVLKGVFSEYYTKKEVDEGREKLFTHTLINYYTKEQVDDKFVECKVCNERHRA